jgi:cell wall-associated NlpC family hydrolase
VPARLRSLTLRLTGLALLVASGVAATTLVDVAGADEHDGAAPSDDEAAAAVDPLADLELTRAEAPDRTHVHDEDGRWLATFTDGARTVTLAGPERTFAEATATADVVTTTWVRLLPEPFDGTVDRAWLDAALLHETPDVLETAAAFLAGAPDVLDDDGVLLSADASYGPLQPDGSRAIGSDWHDFQGVDASYRGVPDHADPAEYRSLDCSGYVRIVYGVHHGVPLTRRPDGGASLPRRSRDQAATAPGVVPIPTDGTQVTELSSLEPGDLVFFDAPADDDETIDHVGIVLGEDTEGRLRFLHSRPSTDGPTMGGDANPTGASVLDGDGYYARGLRSSRRL